MKTFWNDKILKLVIVSGMFIILNLIIYLSTSFEVAVLVILGIIESSIIINTEK